MPLAGSGMLITAMDVAPEEDADFNRWYDQEHLAERVAVDGFLEARRYDAVQAGLKYFNVYTTQTFDVLDSPAYRAVLGRQTAWSRHHIARFINPMRVCGRVTVSLGVGRGGAVACIRLRAADAAAALRPAIANARSLLDQPGILSFHFVEGDAALSRPLTPTKDETGFDDCYLIIDATTPAAASDASARMQHEIASLNAVTVVWTGVWRHLSDIAKAELTLSDAP